VIIGVIIGVIKGVIVLIIALTVIISRSWETPYLKSQLVIIVPEKMIDIGDGGWSFHVSAS